MRIAFETVPVSDRQQWEDALLGLPHGYWHTWRACHALHVGNGWPINLVVARRDGRVVAACPMAERRWEGESDVFTPAGFSGFAGAESLDQELGAAWTDFAAGLGHIAGYFALHPVLAAPSIHSGLCSDNDLFVVDLADGADAALACCDRSVRRALRAWREAGNQYVTCRAALTGFITAHYEPCMDALAVPARARWLQKSVAAMCADPDLLMVGATDERGICAAHTFARSAYGAECHLLLSVRNGRSATTALIAWGMREVASLGLRWLNLGGGTVRGDSLAQFKAKFRARRVPLLRAQEVYRPALFEEMCRRSGTDPSTSAFHPAYRTPDRLSHA
jgi:hypothetical protein